MVLSANADSHLVLCPPDAAGQKQTMGPMDPRWQPHLGAVQPVHAADNLEASGLLAHGWHAEQDECWIAADGQASRMVSLDTWRALRDRSGFVRPKVQPQRS